MQKYICLECGWHGPSEQVLRAANPFAEDEIIEGCPKCRLPSRLTLAYDEPDCWKQVTCGTPTPKGYRRTCGAHAPTEMGGLVLASIAVLAWFSLMMVMVGMAFG